MGGIAVLLGCATPPLESPELVQAEDAAYPRSMELDDTPFFPDDTYYCGPAALATVLVASGVGTSAERLIDQVYLPERQGSLQNELLGAARRADRVPYPLPETLEAILEEIAAGHPVLVLQNLGLEALPRWHYAVVVGYDLEEATVTLRSGEQREESLSLRRFERTWQRGEHWAVVIPPPGETPASADADSWLNAVAELEAQERWQAAHDGYRAAIKRWPDRAEAWLGLGNIEYHTERYEQASQAFARAIENDENLAAAHHNRAWALLAQDRIRDALEAAERSELIAPEHPRYGRTVAAIQAAAEERTTAE